MSLRSEQRARARRLRRAYDYQDPTPGRVAVFIIGVILLDLLVIAAVVTVIVLVLRAFGVL